MKPSGKVATRLKIGSMWAPPIRPFYMRIYAKLFGISTAYPYVGSQPHNGCIAATKENLP